MSITVVGQEMSWENNVVVEILIVSRYNSILYLNSFLTSGMRDTFRI